MNAHWLFLPLSGVFALTLVDPLATGADTRDDGPAALIGQWAAVSFDGDWDGTYTPSGDAIKTGTLTLRQKGYTQYEFREGKLTWQSTWTSFRVDTKAQPHAIDFIVSDGESGELVSRGIYELKGDTLRICRTVKKGGDRPTKFAAEKGSGRELSVWTRKKAEEKDATWVPDASKAKFPDRAASGSVHGQPFTAEVATALPYHASSGNVGDPPAKEDHVDGVTLKLQQGKEAAGATAVVIFCATKAGERVDGKTFVLPPGGLFKQTEKIMDKDGGGWFYPVAGVQVYWQVAPGKADADLLPKATMRLAFGKRKDGKLPGQIYLCVDDKQKTYVVGSFEAVLKDDEKAK
jgi:uncharacterized protein (TIGR03067 family)